MFFLCEVSTARELRSRAAIIVPLVFKSQAADTICSNKRQEKTISCRKMKKNKGKILKTQKAPPVKRGVATKAISLHPLKFEEAVRDLLRVGPSEKGD